jgi:hypothetical protein
VAPLLRRAETAALPFLETVLGEIPQAQPFSPWAVTEGRQIIRQEPQAQIITLHPVDQEQLVAMFQPREQPQTRLARTAQRAPARQKGLVTVAMERGPLEVQGEAQGGQAPAVRAMEPPEPLPAAAVVGGMKTVLSQSAMELAAQVGLGRLL